MRPVLLVVAAIAAFFVWDGLANKGHYWIQLSHTLQQAENFPGLVRVSLNN